MIEKTLVQVRTQIAQMTVISDYLEILKCDARFIGDKVIIPMDTLAFIILEAQNNNK